MNIQDKLFRLRFKVDQNNPHIKLNRELCQSCENKDCLLVCPVENYKYEDGEVMVSWQGCLECGACRIACKKGGSEWQYPRGGFGVCFRFG